MSPRRSSQVVGGKAARGRGIRGRAAAFPAHRVTSKGERYVAEKLAAATPEPAVDLFIVDTSAWARQATEPTVKVRIDRAFDEGEVVLVTPIVLELGYSARNPSEWNLVHKSLSKFAVLPASAHTHAIALELQGALWHSGRVRAAGAFDTMVAALAIEHGATVLHYDADYEHLAAADGRLEQEWVVPRGSLP